jgi:predicted  nucleic acid-binding Zn-ribbon protein
MSGSSPDDKRVGDATLQRIDDLAAGWSVPKRARRADEAPGEPPPREAAAGEPKVAIGSGAGPGDKTRGGGAGGGSGGGSSKKKKPREKTRAKGKERGKTSAARRGPEASIRPLLRSLRGTEQPPEGRPPPVRDDDPDDRLATEVSDRAATRALSERIATEVSERALTRLAPERGDTVVSDNAATLIYGERASTESDHPTIEAAPPGADGEVSRQLSGELAGEPTVPSGRSSDETMLEPPGSGAFAVARADAARMSGSTTAVLRLPQTFHRRRGPWGDALYVFGSIVGVARANRELSAVARKLEAEKESRGRRLADLARLSLADSDLVSEQVARGREEIIELEDQRSRRAGAVAAADAEIAALERGRAEERQSHAQELEALRRGDKDMGEKVEPLQRRVQATRRRATRLLEAMDDLGRRIARAEARLPRLSQDDRAAAEAHIASLLGERQAMADEQPTLAAELDELEPAIAGIIASRADARARVVRVEKAERDAVVRVEEKLTAVRARRVVDERAEAELAQDQEESLAALGERLGVERPAELGSRLRGIEEHEVAIATLDRRHLELSELVKSVDRWAIARGVLWLLALVVGVAAAVVWSYALRAP